MTDGNASIRTSPAYLQCFGKEQYANAALAQKVIRRRTLSRKLRKKKLDRPLCSYRCGHCGRWHIGGMGG